MLKIEKVENGWMVTEALEQFGSSGRVWVAEGVVGLSQLINKLALAIETGKFHRPPGTKSSQGGGFPSWTRVLSDEQGG